MNIKTELKISRPQIAQFLEKWQEKYERKVFHFESEADQLEFHEAIESLVKHIVHVAQQGSMTTIVGKDGIQTLYLKVD